MAKAWHIVDWSENYECNKNTSPWKEGDEFRASSMQYIRVKVFGTTVSPQYQDLCDAAGGAIAGVAFGLFIKMLEVAGDFKGEKRGWILDRKCVPMNAEIMSRRFRFDLPLVVEALKALLVSGWIELTDCDFAADGIDVESEMGITCAENNKNVKMGNSRCQPKEPPTPKNIAQAINEPSERNRTEVNINKIKPKERDGEDKRASLESENEESPPGSCSDLAEGQLGEEKNFGGSTLQFPAVSGFGGSGTGVRASEESGIGNRESEFGDSDAGELQSRGGKASVTQADAYAGSPPGRSPPEGLFSEKEKTKTLGFAWNLLCECFPTVDRETKQGRADKTTIEKYMRSAWERGGVSGVEQVVVLAKEKAASRVLNNPLAAWIVSVKKLSWWKESRIQA